MKGLSVLVLGLFLSCTSESPTYAATPEAPETAATLQEIPLREQIRAAAESMAQSTSPASSQMRSPSGCAIGISALTGGAIWIAAVAVNPNMYVNGQPGWESTLTSKGAANAVGGIATALLGAVVAAKSCGHKVAAAVPQPTYVPPTSYVPAPQPVRPQYVPPLPVQGSSALPPAQAVGRNRDGSTTTTIKNDTRYSLRVSIAGLTFVVGPGAARTIPINPGVYQEEVTALDSGIAPFSGTQQYTAGTAYDETYYIVTRTTP